MSTADEVAPPPGVSPQAWRQRFLTEFRHNRHRGKPPGDRTKNVLTSAFTATALYCATRCGLDGTGIGDSLLYIAEGIGSDETTVGRAVRALHRSGFLTPTQAGNRRVPPVYALMLPPAVGEAERWTLIVDVMKGDRARRRKIADTIAAAFPNEPVPGVPGTGVPGVPGTDDPVESRVPEPAGTGVPGVPGTQYSNDRGEVLGVDGIPEEKSLPPLLHPAAARFERRRAAAPKRVFTACSDHVRFDDGCVNCDGATRVATAARPRLMLIQGEAS